MCSPPKLAKLLPQACVAAPGFVRTTLLLGDERPKIVRVKV
jgi:hypothetical protein